MNTESIFGLISLIISAGALVIAWRKGKAERSNLNAGTANLDANTAEKYQGLAAKAADREAKLMDRVETLEGQVDDLEQKLERQQKELDALRDWAKRLAAQVVSLGGQPVQLKAVESG